MRLLRRSRIELAVTVFFFLYGLSLAQDKQPQPEQTQSTQRQPQQGGGSAIGGLLSGLLSLILKHTFGRQCLIKVRYFHSQKLHVQNEYKSI